MSESSRSGGDATLGELALRFLATVEDHAVCTMDRHGQVLSWNVGGQRITGHRAHDLVGRSFDALYLPEHVQSGLPRRHLDDAADSGCVRYEGWRARADGSRFWAYAVLSAVRDDEQRLSGFGEITRDITESRRLQRDLMRRALHDPLTGLPNRALFLDRLGKAVGRLARHPGRVAVLFVDLDGFKAVNDSLGHQAGDRVLATVAERLRHVLRTQDTVARLGGDEFVVLCDDIGDEPSALGIARRMATSLEEPIDVAGTLVLARASIGIAMADSADLEPETLLCAADAAMYRAKRHMDGRRVRYVLQTASIRPAAPE